MSKTTNKFAPEVRERAVRMVLEHESEHPSRWAAITSIATMIDCSGHTLLEWVKKAEVNSGKRAGVPSELADRLKALASLIHDARFWGRSGHFLPLAVLRGRPTSLAFVSPHSD